MFSLLDVACNDIALANFFVIVKRALTIGQIFGPIICIISLTLNLTKGTFNPDDKKQLKKILNIVLALLITLFVPVIVNATMGLIGESTNFSSCWKSASNVVNNGKRGHIIVEDDDDDERKPLLDPDKYEGNKPVPNSNNGGSSNSNGQGGSSSIVLIGDSRIVQTYEYLSDDWGNQANYSGGGVHTYDSTIFVAEGGKGIVWLKSTGIPAASSYFKSGTAIVIMMGVNDVDTPNIADTYVAYINNNVDSWTANGGKVYFAAVTPCNSQHTHLNPKIDNFNAKLRNSLSSKVGWIDTDVYIKSQGYKTRDGLHYDKETTLKIYNYIKSKV